MTRYSTRWLVTLFLTMASLAGCTREVLVIAPPVGADGGAPLGVILPSLPPADLRDAAAEDGQIPQPLDDSGTGPAGMIELVAPQLSYDFDTGVYTATFRIKNGSADDVLEFSSIKVMGSYGFPEIDRAVCPPDTPGYPWNVPAGAISKPLAVVFASSSATLKTAIAVTCGPKEALQSVPYGFNANPPFIMKIDLVLGSGSSVTLEHELNR
jgi:hypothetical protein